MNIPKLIATFFGVGLAPKAPGTFGSIAALPLAWLVQHYAGNLGLLVFSWIIFVIGTLACNIYVKQVGRDDPPEAVIDEVAGQCFLLSVIPATIPSYVIGLLLFRFFDILKPFPIRIFERRIKGGLGVMVDDMAAAAYPILIALLLCLATRTDISSLSDWLAQI